MTGFLLIPSLKIAVPVYEAQNGNGQDVIDRPNSAVLLRWGNLTIIADHRTQSNFENLNRAEPSKTKAFFITNGKMHIYKCDYSAIGHNRTEPTGNHLYDNHWAKVTQIMHDGIVMYTCIVRSAKDVMDVRLTHWRKV